MNSTFQLIKHYPVDSDLSLTPNEVMSKSHSKSLREKKISSKISYRGKFIDVIKDQVCLPDGSKGIREYIHHPGAAMIIPTFKDGKILIIKQFRYPLNKVFIEFPAGKIDKGETSLQTAKRELYEETGYRAKKWKFITTIHPVIGYADEKIDIFAASDLSRDATKEHLLEHGEFLIIEKMKFSQLLKLAKSGKLTDVKTLIGVLWLNSFLKF